MTAPRPTVLVVDDEPHVRSSLRRTIRRTGCRVLTADNGHDALALLADEKVDLLITDMRMPVMNGAELLGNVTSKYPEIVRVLLTGYADLTLTTDAIRQGLTDHFLVKPWEPEDITACVSKALGLGDDDS